ncbi:hypothetical protein ABZ446_16600 [Streptomyces sp. NPDC005813]|uniref:hypothetical protein n=1 Tax=Streptomyces sp. NPDC005813 TaxID=3155592 RepID=UPI0033CCA441
MIEGFARAVRSLPECALDHLRAEAARTLGQRAARAALAPVMWAELSGDMIDTTRASEALGVSRQALAKRVAAGTLLGIPGRGTTHFPVWQFTPNWGLSPDAQAIFKIFREALGRLDPYAVMSWMATPSEELNGLTPEQWLTKKQDSEPVLAEARRTAERLAS